MREDRRSFISRWWLVVFAAGRGLQTHWYSFGSKVGPWAGWFQDKAGKTVAFFTKSGEIVWMK